MGSVLVVSPGVTWLPFGWQFDDALERLAAAVPAEALLDAAASDGLPHVDLSELPASRFAPLAAAARTLVREQVEREPGADPFWAAQSVFGLSLLSGLLSADPRAGYTPPPAGRLTLTARAGWTAPDAVFALVCEHLAGALRPSDRVVAERLLTGEADLSRLPAEAFATLLVPLAWMMERYGPGRTLAAAADTFMAELAPHVDALAELVRTDPRTRGFQLYDLLRRRSDGATGEVILISDLPQRTYCVAFEDGARAWIEADQLEPARTEHFRTAAAAFLVTDPAPRVPGGEWPAVGPIWSRVEHLGDHRLVQVFFSGNRFFELLREQPVTLQDDPLAPLAAAFRDTAITLGAEVGWIDVRPHHGVEDWDARLGSTSVNLAFTHLRRGRDRCADAGVPGGRLDALGRVRDLAGRGPRARPGSGARGLAAVGGRRGVGTLDMTRTAPAG